MSGIEFSTRFGKICPLCRRECIEAWETVCSSCWTFLGKLDRENGTTFQQQIIDNKKVVIFLPPVILKLQTCYYPLTANERRERIRKIIDDQCSGCTRNMQAGTEDPCWSCVWQWMMNEILGNGK